MKTVEVRLNGERIASVLHARGFFVRLRGLLGRSITEDGGLMLTPCNSIHTVGMGYPIDAVYLDKFWRVLRVDDSLAAGKVCPMERRARHVLELSAGRAKKYAIKAGDILEVIP